MFPTNTIAYTVRFEMRHVDTILSIKQMSTSAYAQHNVKQAELPKLISELTDKGYVLVSIRRGYEDDE